MNKEQEPKIAVTFDLSYLIHLCIKEAGKLEFLEGKPLFAKLVYSDHEETYIEGVEVSTREDEVFP